MERRREEGEVRLDGVEGRRDGGTGPRRPARPALGPTIPGLLTVRSPVPLSLLSLPLSLTLSLCRGLLSLGKEWISLKGTNAASPSTIMRAASAGEKDYMNTSSQIDEE